MHRAIEFGIRQKDIYLFTSHITSALLQLILAQSSGWRSVSFIYHSLGTDWYVGDEGGIGMGGEYDIGKGG